MKERKRIHIEEAEIPMSSMIDVVFLLLIYFLVVQKPIIENTLLKSDLPAPGPSVAPTNPSFLRIDVIKQKKNDGNEYYRMNGGWWKDEQLFAHLENIAQDDPETTVVINCGPNAKHQKLISLLDACAEAELKNLNIVNDASIKFNE